jgi:transcriptional regulator with GAF, ATPase, and Fis domain
MARIETGVRFTEPYVTPGESQLSSGSVNPLGRAEQEWIDIEGFLRPFAIGGLIGESDAIREVSSRIQRLAKHKGTVLIQGESGTGKELVARALHQLGPTASGPLVSFNCSNLVEGLAESQLFGHVKGAFTHAREAHTGCFRQANGGTLLLDEIGELPLAMQSKLLRVTEKLEVQAVGSTETYHLDLRLIAATNRDLRQMAASGGFRADLFYRLDVGSIRMPRLRERPNDVPLLIAHFVERYNRSFGKRAQYISRRALDWLCGYAWPGNVRELAHAIERALLLSHDERIDLDDLPEDLFRSVESNDGLALSEPTGERSPTAPSDLETGGTTMTLDDVMKDAVRRSLEQARGDCARAARLLGISRPAIYRKMVRFGITNASLQQYRKPALRHATPDSSESAAVAQASRVADDDFPLKSRPAEKPDGGFYGTANDAGPESPIPERRRQ